MPNRLVIEVSMPLASLLSLSDPSSDPSGEASEPTERELKLESDSERDPSWLERTEWDFPLLEWGSEGDGEGSEAELCSDDSCGEAERHIDLDADIPAVERGFNG